MFYFAETGFTIFDALFITGLLLIIVGYAVRRYLVSKNEDFEDRDN